ncbi:hypothetical protein [Streptomyces alanosinicus]|uniref:Uncharacterized protein n=1 Tax=Streptomyces alanosinicus TaxID=68171 RepID=A0A919D6Z7_9ACTN|nr:hypothetical protein [Streptomyces alanosinicus]GHE11920.1 hypothetical protein GCM10010339_73350 [Streptomyces alanosinicus]
MASLHQAVAERQLVDLLATRETAVALVQARSAHLSGRFGSYGDAIGQQHRTLPSRWRAEQHASFLMVHAAVASGRAAVAAVALGQAPAADADRALNGRALGRLPQPYCAEVDPDQKSGRCDGLMRWETPAVARQSTGCSFTSVGCRSPYPVPVYTRTWLDPMEIPLEVGDSLPSRTWAHLEQDGGVARWPYGSAFVWIFVSRRS